MNKNAVIKSEVIKGEVIKSDVIKSEVIASEVIRSEVRRSEVTRREARRRKVGRGPILRLGCSALSNCGLLGVDAIFAESTTPRPSVNLSYVLFSVICLSSKKA